MQGQGPQMPGVPWEMVGFSLQASSILGARRSCMHAHAQNRAGQRGECLPAGRRIGEKGHGGQIKGLSGTRLRRYVRTPKLTHERACAPPLPPDLCMGKMQ